MPLRKALSPTSPLHVYTGHNGGTTQRTQSRPTDKNELGDSSHKAEPESKQIIFSTASSGSLHNYCLTGFGNCYVPGTPVCLACFPFVNIGLLLWLLIPLFSTNFGCGRGQTTWQIIRIPIQS